MRAAPIKLDDVRNAETHRIVGTLRPFVAWDGEGITYDGEVSQSYVLFGASTGDRIMGHSLSTKQCLDLLLDVEMQHPNAIHVGFGFGYDANMIVKDIPYDLLQRLYKTNRIRWGDYLIDWLPGKWFNVKRGKVTMRVFETFGFFQSSFLVACEKFLGKDDPLLQIISEGKAARRTFSFDELETLIIPYWETELTLFLRLMDQLRKDLLGAGLQLFSWHGPGAVANTVLKQKGIQRYKDDSIPEEVNRAAQYAYAGGRFELIRCGHHPGKVYQYDLNSAYPAAASTLPSLNEGSWERTEVFDADAFGVWYIEHMPPDAADMLRAWPLYVRDEHGNVSFPPLAAGWYWTPEAELARDYVHHGWVFQPRNATRPFSWIHDMYRQRAIWKAEGNSSERALKLALNSIYGKMAQRAGWKPGGSLPKWHQLEWAGYVTSLTRRRMYDALSTNPDAVIAFETDAIFTTEPLDLTIGDDLGEWGETTYDWITYIQNGLYYAQPTTGATGRAQIIEKYRGFDKGSLPHSRVLDTLQHPEIQLYGDTTRFVGLGLALHTNYVWRSWLTGQRAVKVGGGGKRAHIPGLCPQCQQGIGLHEALHSLAVTTPGGRSFPHSLPWVDDSIDVAVRESEQLLRM